MRKIGVASMLAMLVVGCGSGKHEAAKPTTTENTPPVVVPPVKRGDWTFYGKAQGLSDDIQDVSADEGGNVYVAGGDALYVKRAADQSFLRFDAANAGLTKTCNDPADYHNETPAKPFTMCRVLAVAGASPGKAIIGFDGFNLEPQDGALWTFLTGGADVVTFDPAASTLTRQRHVRIASPPHVICTNPVYARASTCADPTNWWWMNGRRMMARVRRIVVNHDTKSALYGDVWFGGKHGTFAALLANAAARNMPDHTVGFLPEWADAKDVWEHDHPGLWAPDGSFVNGEGWALSIDPRDGTIWGSNGYRTTTMTGGYGADLSNDDWFTGTKYDLWPDPPDQFTGDTADNIQSMSHCPDGTLWLGSLTHGLVRIDPALQVSFTSLPDPALKNSVSAVACDPTDSSVWIGLGVGGITRLRNGAFEPVDLSGLPAFTANPVQSIQIDRWSATRTVYFAFAPMSDGNGAIVQGGGVASYSGN